MDITCISDLHGYYPKLEGGDLLIVAGDLTAKDDITGHSDVLNWLHKQDYKKKVVIAGNHDNFLQKNPNFYSETHITYLCDSGTEFEGLKIWGSPWTSTFEGINPKCMAFTEHYSEQEKLNNKWGLIPDNIDILITHVPPYWILDKIKSRTQPRIDAMNHVGCKYLADHVQNRIKPLLHVFGHIHEQGGRMVFGGRTKFINASIVNELYEHVNKPMRVIL